MRVLGIDPGLTRCGVGVVEGDVGRPLRLVDVGVVRTSSDLPVAERLVSIDRALDRRLDTVPIGQPSWLAASLCVRPSRSHRTMGVRYFSGRRLNSRSRDSASSSRGS